LIEVHTIDKYQVNSYSDNLIYVKLLSPILQHYVLAINGNICIFVPFRYEYFARALSHLGFIRLR